MSLSSYVALSIFLLNFFEGGSACKGVLYGNRCVMVGDEQNWYNVHKSDDCHLVSVTDTGLIKAVSDYLVNKSVSSAWIAAHRQKVWHWLDGSEIKITQWGVDEPSDLGGSESHLQMMQKLQYRWNDEQGGTIYRAFDGGVVFKFICEYKEMCNREVSLDPRVQVGDRCFVMQAKRWHDAFDGKCVNSIKYRHNWGDYCSSKGINWYDANQFCQKGPEGRLAVLNTKERMNLVTDMVTNSVVSNKKYGGDYWLGGYAHGRNWVYGYGGENIKDTALIPGGSENCGILSKDGTLTSGDCFGRRLPPLCYTVVDDTISLPAVGATTSALPTTTNSADEGWGSGEDDIFG